MVAPDDVRAVAEDEGIPIYVISTNEVNKDSVSSGVFKRISTKTGGKSYFAKTWQRQVEAFESIREDLGNSYTVTYYPQPNPNEGFRKINVDIVSDVGRSTASEHAPDIDPAAGSDESAGVSNGSNRRILPAGPGCERSNRSWIHRLRTDWRAARTRLPGAAGYVAGRARRRVPAAPRAGRGSVRRAGAWLWRFPAIARGPQRRSRRASRRPTTGTR